MPEMKSLTLNDKTYDCFVDSVARSKLESAMVIGSKAGENIVVSDATNYNLIGLSIYGKTTQNGTPTPDKPVDLVSVGNSGSITVNVSGKNEEQNMTIATPNGLPGIPVASGGNYTDANGQQWICDEIDFARGVYVQRVNRVELTGTEALGVATSSNNTYVLYLTTALDNPIGDYGYCTSFIYSPTKAYNGLLNNIGFQKSSGGARLWLCTTMNAENAKGYFAERYASKSPVTILYPLSNPIETPLSEEELAAYASLHTYRDSTTISNDAGAYMELEYVMDSKKYIDSKIASSILTATVE